MRNGRDLAIGLGDRSPGGPSCGGDGGVGLRGVAVEGQNAPGQILAQDAVHSVNQRGAAFAVPHDREAVAQLCLRYRGQVDV